MGMTPLEGLVMGTRSGDIDPSIHQFLSENLSYSEGDITNLLNKKSGLLGVSGVSNDMRELLEAIDEGNEQAKLAVDVFCYRLAKNIASLAVPLGRLDALIFTGGIGENGAAIESVAKKKAPDSPVAGKATVFIFPDLNTGNPTYKAVQRSADVVSIGPMLQGLNKPVNDLSRGALVDDIVYTIALTEIQVNG